METGQRGRTDVPLNTKPQTETSSPRSSGRNQTVRDVMTRNPQTVGSNESLDRVAKLMLEHDCGAIPVVDNNQVTGMITDRDIVIRVVAEGRNPKEAKVSDAMTRGAQIVRENDSIDRVMDLMSQHQIRRVPVVDDRGGVIGIIAQADLATEIPDENKVARTVEEISEKSGAPQR